MDNIDRIVNNLMRLQEGGIADDPIDWAHTDIKTLKQNNANLARDLNKKAGHKTHDEYGATIGHSAKNFGLYGAAAGALSGAALGPVGVLGGAIGGALHGAIGGATYRAGSRALHSIRDKSKKKPRIFEW